MTPQPKERPILFSGPMVRALLSGRKTQTRRVMNPQPGDNFHPDGVRWYAPTRVDRRGEEYPGKEVYGAADESEGHICPYGVPGGRLWVRETWAPVLKNGGVLCRHDRFSTQPNPVEYMRQATDYVIYSADETDPAKRRHRWGSTTEERWRTPLFMPRWASRLTLEITDIRVQRLNDITEEDALAEGTQEPTLRELSADLKQAAWSERQVFSRLWDSISAKRGHGWATNPWVWALTFRGLP